MSKLGPRYEGQVVPQVRHLTARDVLDLHADLHRSMARRDPVLRECMTEYGLLDVERNLVWAPSHLNPATSLNDLDPWLDSFATDLFGATTYQVTAEMVELAEGLSVNTPNLGEIRPRELPSTSGFMWLDKPVPRPAVDDDGRPPQLMHAVSWQAVPRIQIQVGDTGETGWMPAVRLRKWGYNDDPNVFPRPLHLMGQNTVLTSKNVNTPLTDLHLIHMIWILMGMKITVAETETPGRQGRKRAANLKHQLVNVVHLRRPKHREATGEHRTVDWTCTWIVRGHPRAAPHGGTFADGRTETWIDPYLKGPDGLPLRASDILYRLSR